MHAHNVTEVHDDLNLMLNQPYDDVMVTLNADWSMNGRIR